MSSGFTLSLFSDYFFPNLSDLRFVIPSTKDFFTEVTDYRIELLRDPLMLKLSRNSPSSLFSSSASSAIDYSNGISPFLSETSVLRLFARFNLILLIKRHRKFQYFNHSSSRDGIEKFCFLVCVRSIISLICISTS